MGQSPSPHEAGTAAAPPARTSSLSLVRVPELDVSSAHGWSRPGPLQVMELSPPVDVDRGSALVEATVQSGVSSNPAQTPSDSFVAPAARLVRLEDALIETRMCVAMSPRFGFVRESVRQGRRKLERAG